MGRTRRQQLAGAAFHITARTQGKARWFRPAFRPEIEQIILDGIASSDAMLISEAVMPNHFHLMIRQGNRPLGWVMQPMIRRIALLVQRRLNISGHVFERTFRSVLYSTPRRLRRAVVYTHINPVRAKICNRVDAYPWTSHAKYVIDDTGVAAVEVSHVLKLFGNEPGESLAQLSTNYQKYLEWRLEKDRHKAAGKIYGIREPSAHAGDDYFYEFFCGAPVNLIPKRIDLRDRAIQILRKVDSSLTVDELRKRYMPRFKRAARSQVVAGLLTDKYANYAIADFFGVSDTTISRIASAMRYSILEQNGNC